MTTSTSFFPGSNPAMPLIHTNAEIPYPSKTAIFLLPIVASAILALFLLQILSMKTLTWCIWERIIWLNLHSERLLIQENQNRFQCPLVNLNFEILHKVVWAVPIDHRQYMFWKIAQLKYPDLSQLNILNYLFIHGIIGWMISAEH